MTKAFLNLTLQGVNTQTITIFKKTLTGKYKCILERLRYFFHSFAFAAKQLHESGVKTINNINRENIDYHNHAKSIIPDDLTEYLSMIQSDRVQENKNGIDICYYKNIPDMRYDLIFVDGPSLTQKNGRKTINYDLINIFNSNENFKADVIIDQRIATYWTYKKIFYGSKSSYHPIKQLGFVKIDNSHIDFNKFNKDSLWWHDESSENSKPSSMIVIIENFICILR